MQNYNKIEYDSLYLIKHTISTFPLGYCLGIFYLILTSLKLDWIISFLTFFHAHICYMYIHILVHLLVYNCLFSYKCDHSIDISQWLFFLTQYHTSWTPLWVTRCGSKLSFHINLRYFLIWVKQIVFTILLYI